MNKKQIFDLLDKEVRGLNIKTKNARNKLIFSYNDVAQILAEQQISKNKEVLEIIDKWYNGRGIDLRDKTLREIDSEDIEELKQNFKEKKHERTR